MHDFTCVHLRSLELGERQLEKFVAEVCNLINDGGYKTQAKEDAMGMLWYSELTATKREMTYLPWATT